MKVCAQPGIFKIGCMGENDVGLAIEWWKIGAEKQGFPKTVIGGRIVKCGCMSGKREYVLYKIPNRK